MKNQQLWIEKEHLGTGSYLVELLTTDGLLGERHSVFFDLEVITPGSMDNSKLMNTDNFL